MRAPFTCRVRSVYHEMMKVGRNDPCPCGSGRKYKHCCLRKDEARPGARGASSEQPGERDDPVTVPHFFGQGTAVSPMHDELAGALRGRSTASMSDVERFIDQRTRWQNDAPVGVLEGLSADQMRRLLSRGMYGTPDIVTMHDALPDDLALDANVVATTKWILGYFADHGGEIRLTDRGNFPRTMCARFLSLWPVGQAVPLEQSIPSLVRAHDYAREVGFIGESHRKAWITTEGVQMYSSDRWAKAFREMLRYVLERLDWKALLPPSLQYSRFRIIQEASPFAMRLLARHPEGSEHELFKRFATAFPALLEPTGGNPDAIEILRDVFTLLFLHELCDTFGLVVLEWTGGDEDSGETLRYATTDLFRAAFRWA